MSESELVLSATRNGCRFVSLFKFVLLWLTESAPEKNEVLGHARSICGICFSNPTSETRRTTCYALIVCGPFFSDVNEQEQVIRLMRQTETDDGWPTESVVRELIEEWEIPSS